MVLDTNQTKKNMLKSTFGVDDDMKSCKKWLLEDGFGLKGGKKSVYVSHGDGVAMKKCW